jgi:hypothetical protein
MALAVMLSGQAYISLMDRIDHAHHHAHFPNVLAGDLQYCGGDGDRCDHHDHGTHGKIGHNHGDAAIVFLAAQSFVFAICPLEAARCETEPPTLASISLRGPDHPPKLVLEITA